MISLNLLINVCGLLYGIGLIATAFIRTPLTEAMRIDALFIREYTEQTRPLNLVAGMLVAGYAAWTLLIQQP